MTRRLRLALLAYRALWWAGLPFALLYLRIRARRDPAYGLHLDERFGRGPTIPGAVWVHAVSLGEMRSAVPLVRALLDHGERVVTTHLTPAGRRAAEAAFGPEIAEGRLLARYLPLETGPAFRRFLAATRPRLALALEVEFWPVMIAETARAGVPLWLVNSQVPGRSFPRARMLARLLGHPVAGVSGVLAKSRLQAGRFRALGARVVHVTGELRFDQPVPPALVAAAARLRPHLGRPVVTVASVVEGEDALYIDLLRRLRAEAAARGAPAPLLIHVPRAPERFAEAGDLLDAAGLSVLRRSRALGPDLSGDPAALAGADVLLGDSMGEMFFYLALCDAAVAGGGFLPSGAHNVIEPLALRRPVFTGPHTWTIEYPAAEAEAAGVLSICPDVPAMAGRIAALLADPAAQVRLSEQAEAFFAAHAGATARAMAVLGPILEARGRVSP
jgi:3-deoxy-D-manno-octulosonic-acid transferase